MTIGPEGLILVAVMGLIGLAAAAGAVVMARRSWSVLVGPAPALPADAAPPPIARPASGQYAGWGREKRVAHWVRSLERSAREAARSGISADQVFTPALVDQMRRTDPHIELLLPLVLADLADGHGVDPAQLSAVFAHRTGVAVDLPPALVQERRQERGGGLAGLGGQST